MMAAMRNKSTGRSLQKASKFDANLPLSEQFQLFISERADECLFPFLSKADLCKLA